ncbi:PREDICTED: RNA-binding protein EWS-like, partial [Eurypyga helias]|uniref:RNA-binding protein EWS-like n=1 Tax=Eurypyga helias TaxID=54383 RepID=UPI00052852A3
MRRAPPALRVAGEDDANVVSLNKTGKASWKETCFYTGFPAGREELKTETNITLKVALKPNNRRSDLAASQAVEHYSTYSQAAAQQGYSAYAPQPAQGYAQTTQQTYGQQSYGTYGQPADISYTQPPTTATYGQTAYATSYGQPPTGYTAPTAPPAYSQPVQGYGTPAYDTNTATVTTTQASYAAPSPYGPQPAYPAYGQQPAPSAPASQPGLGYGQSNYSYPQVPASYPMQPVTAPPSYPPT